MNDKKLLGIGIVGTIVSALCCFTPVLVVLLGAIGLSAVIRWLDFVLLPTLVAFVLVSVYALLRRARRKNSEHA